MRRQAGNRPCRLRRTRLPPGNWADSALRTSKFSAADARETPAAQGLAAARGPGRPKLGRVAQSNASNNSAKISVVLHFQTEALPKFPCAPKEMHQMTYSD